MNRGELATLSLAAALGIAGAYHAQLPGAYEARKMREDRDFRATQVSLLLLSLALAGVLALWTDSPVPFYSVMGTSAALALYYEWAVRSNGDTD